MHPGLDGIQYIGTGSLLSSPQFHAVSVAFVLFAKENTLTSQILVCKSHIEIHVPLQALPV
jgi:hypothetical protein